MVGWPPRDTLGIRPPDLTAEHLAGILRCYDEATGADISTHRRADQELARALEDLRGSASLWESRYGYPGNCHGKLVIRDGYQSVLRILLDTNDDVNGGYPEASLQLIARFRELVYAYLQQKNVAAEIPA
jgi:hypothetical protein